MRKSLIYKGGSAAAAANVATTLRQIRKLLICKGGSAAAPYRAAEK